MKIITQTDQEMLATDNQVSQVVIGAILVIVGLAMGSTILGGSKMAIIAMIGGFLLLLGLFSLISFKNRKVAIGKATASVVISVQKLWGKKEYAYALPDVQKLQLVSTIQNNLNTPPGGSSSTTQLTKLIMVMKNGEMVDIADGSRGLNFMGMFSKVPNQGVGQQIATFIGVPFEAEGEVPLGQMISEVKSLINKPSASPSPTASTPAPTPPPATPQPPPTQPPQTPPTA